MNQSEQIISFLRDHLTEEDTLCQIAEEASELAQAALKMRRAITGGNPTPATLADCADGITDEWADLNVCMEVFGQTIPGRYERTREFKLRRWFERLGGTNGR